MFTFKSPANPKNIWTLCFRDRKTMDNLFYEGRQPDDNARIHGFTEFVNSTIYIDKELDGVPLSKVLRHELTHVYLWETGQQNRMCNEEEICEIMSVAAPEICRVTNEIILRLKEGLYKKGE